MPPTKRIYQEMSQFAHNNSSKANKSKQLIMSKLTWRDVASIYGLDPAVPMKSFIPRMKAVPDEAVSRVLDEIKVPDLSADA